MKLSVFIPTFNRVEYLRQAVESVLTQSFHDYRVFVVDNASTDATPTYCSSVRDKRFAWFRNESNLGMVGNWQKCLDLCKTEWFAMLEDDNLWKTSFLEQTFRPNEDIVMSHSGAYVFTDADGKIGARQTGWWQANNSGSCVLDSVEYSFWQSFASQIAASTAIFKTDVARQVGGYRKDISAAQDWDLLSRIGRAGKVLSLQDELVGYRIHGSRASINPVVVKQMKKDAFRIAAENWEWAMQEASEVEPDLSYYINKVPLGQVFGLLEALSCAREKCSHGRSVQQLWNKVKQFEGQRPILVRFFGRFGLSVMQKVWQLKTKGFAK